MSPASKIVVDFCTISQVGLGLRVMVHVCVMYSMCRPRPVAMYMASNEFFI